MPTSGPGVAARQERRRARQACGLLARPGRCVAQVNGEGAGCVGLLGPRKSWSNGFSRAGQKPEMRGEKDFLFFLF
jgi:hypothetical protein